jgi:hypothetical protein
MPCPPLNFCFACIIDPVRLLNIQSHSCLAEGTIGRTIALAVSRRPLTAEARVRTQADPYRICGGQSGTGTDSSYEIFGFPLSVSFHRGSILIYHLGNEQ